MHQYQKQTLGQSVPAMFDNALDEKKKTKKKYKHVRLGHCIVDPSEEWVRCLFCFCFVCMGWAGVFRGM